MLRICTAEYNTDVVAPMYHKEKISVLSSKLQRTEIRQLDGLYYSPKAKSILFNLWKNLKPNSAKPQLEKNNNNPPPYS